MTLAQRTTDVLLWREPKTSALLLLSGTVFFFFVGVLAYSSLGLLCLLCALHLGTRLAWYNTVGSRPAPPTDLFSEADIQAHVAVLTERANTVAIMGHALLTASDSALTLQCVGGLMGISLLCRFFGTTGFFFLLFVAAFTLPRAYEAKKSQVDAALAAARQQMSEAYRKAAAAIPSIPRADQLSQADKKKL